MSHRFVKKKNLKKAIKVVFGDFNREGARCGWKQELPEDLRLFCLNPSARSRLAPIWDVIDGESYKPHIIQVMLLLLVLCQNSMINSYHCL